MTEMVSYTKAAIAARFGNQEKGATAVEYGLMVALIAVAIIVGVALLGTNLQALFNDIAVRLGVVVP